MSAGKTRKNRMAYEVGDTVRVAADGEYVTILEIAPEFGTYVIEYCNGSRAVVTEEALRD